MQNKLSFKAAIFDTVDLILKEGAFLKRLLILLMAISCFVVGCKTNVEGENSSTYTNSETQSVPSNVVSSSTESDEQNSAPEYENLLQIMSDNGKSVAAYGDLKNAEFSDALAELESILNNYTRNVSLVVYSLDNRKALSFNTEAEMFCACTVKAPYSLYCCYEMENGNGSLETKMAYEEKHYEWGTGDMQYSPYGTVFTIETMIDKSMRISDNVGYMMSVDYFGRNGYNEWISSIGCPSLQIKPTVWSLRAKAKELAVAWCHIYDYFKTNSTYSQFLYNSCTNTPNNYATAALKGIDISHKQGNNRTGKWLAYSDAGIVWKTDNPYIIVIFTDAPGPSSYDSKLMSDVINIVHNKLF